MAHTAIHGMNRAQLAAKLELFKSEVLALEQIKPTCTICIFGQQPLKCDKWGNVPKEVWAKGCDDWLWDEIPF